MNKKLRIIHVEDDPADAALIEAAMDCNGFECEFHRVETEDSLKAALAEMPCDLVLSDFTMPRFNGREALKLVKKQAPDLPFILVSGTVGEELAVECLHGGASDFVLKDQRNQLPERVARVMEAQALREKNREAELALRKSQSRLRNLIESSLDMIIAVNKDGRIVEFNSAAQDTFGYAWEEVDGKPVTMLYEDLTEARDVHDHTLSNGSCEREVTNVRKNGQGFTSLLRASVLHNDQGDVIGVMGVSRDITASLEAKEKLKDQARLLDLASDAILVCDLDGAILYWNMGAERLYGWHQDEAIGQAQGKFFPISTKQFEESKARLLESGEWAQELEQVAKNGDKKLVDSRWTLVRDESGKPKSILIIASDLTEKKHLETQFLRAQRLESVGTLASGISHDLNNILSPILMAAELLEMDPDDQHRNEFIQSISSSAQRGVKIVKQVLTFARGAEGERVLFHPRHIVSEIRKLIQETFPKSVTVRTQVPKDLWQLRGDPTQLHQVLLNLCVNARDAMPEGGVLNIDLRNEMVDRLYATMTPGQEPGAKVILEVSDSGTGIPNDIREKIFEPFFTTKAAGKGTGLGLSTVVGIVRGHGGTVDIVSRPGQGTKFTITFPAVVEPSADKSSEDEANQLPMASGETILIVEDEEPLRVTTAELLEHYGFKTLSAEDGSDGLALYAEHRNEIRAVLTDVAMPIMDGYALVRVLKKIAPQLPILAATGHSSHTRFSELANLGVDEVLRKPYPTEALIRFLHDAVNGNGL